jgi:TnpA family transposase
MPRMNILSTSEKDEFDTPPIFNSAQRKQFFETPPDLMQEVNKLRTPANKIAFVLAYGYFSVGKRFFLPKRYHRSDIEYVSRKLGFAFDEFDPTLYPQRTAHYHQTLILTLCGFKVWGRDTENFIHQEIRSMVLSNLKPNLIFWRCVDLMIREKIQIPGYNRISDMILKALQARKSDLTTLIQASLSLENQALLDTLFRKDGDTDPNSEKSPYKLTTLKKLSQSSKPAKVSERLDDLLYLKNQYYQLRPVFSALNLDHEAIRYYAGSVIKSRIFQISRREEEDRYLHVTAFIAHQFFSLQDNLVDVFLSTVKTFENAAGREHKEQSFERRKEQTRSVQVLLDKIEIDVFGVLDGIQTILNDQAIDPALKITEITRILKVGHPHIQGAKSEHSTLKQDIEQYVSDDQYYDILESRSIKLQNRVSGIIKVLEFQAENSAQSLMEAIQHYKEKNGAINKNAPNGFLVPEEYRAVYPETGSFRTSLYKAFLFQHIASAIKSGTLNLQHSYKYQSLDKYMISKERWQNEKEALMHRAGMQEFRDPREVLEILDKALHQQYQTTNANIAAGENLFIKISKNKAYNVATPKQDEIESDPLKSFFPEQNYVPLTEILSTVNHHSGFLGEFQHWQNRYTKNSATNKLLYAGIMGLGCSIGTRKMAKISPNIKENALQHTVNWYFSLENVQAANDAVLKLMNQMELPNIYRKCQDTLHTASDGQKFEVRSESLNANYSFKYFGKGQGASAYTFIDERNLLWHSLVFSASERESAYVVDGLMRNDVIKSDIHSTDTHGYSEAIFATTHMLGFSYAPRIKNLKKQSLYIFKSGHHADKSNWHIKPDNYVNADLIIQNWDDILRLIATIKLKETSASDIFRRLNSYSRQNVLYKALKAFGQIVKSLFILRYIDDVQLRQDIEKQLNKVELSNRFTRAIAVGSPREFIHAEKEEQEIAESCNRLIKNSIICWNYLYLSQKLAMAENDNNKQILLKAISTHSPMSWAHINLLGEYDFSDEKLKDSFGIKPPKMAA